MNIEDEEVEIPEMARPEGWKSIEQKRREYRERNREYLKEYNKRYKEKYKMKLKKQNHDRYIRTLKRAKQDRILRYHNDPEWREQVKAYNRERHRRIREEKRAAREAEEMKKNDNK